MIHRDPSSLPTGYHHPSDSFVIGMVCVTPPVEVSPKEARHTSITKKAVRYFFFAMCIHGMCDTARRGFPERGSSHFHNKERGNLFVNLTCVSEAGKGREGNGGSSGMLCFSAFMLHRLGFSVSQLSCYIVRDSLFLSFHSGSSGILCFSAFMVDRPGFFVSQL